MAAGTCAVRGQVEGSDLVYSFLLKGEGDTNEQFKDVVKKDCNHKWDK